MARGQRHYRKNGRNTHNSGMSAAKIITIRQMNPNETPELHREIAERAAKSKALARITDERAIILSEEMLMLFADLDALTSSCIRERIGLLFAKALRQLRFDHIREDPVIQDAKNKTEDALRQVFESVSSAA